ncbi:MAG: bifunctional DNA-formamidopyrimidine glycosylase/DNA-(apurinic or apyrimidinic site) lyase [bacterium]
MPELPEVETIVRELNQQILRLKITEAILIRADMLKRTGADQRSLAAALDGCAFDYVERFGKYLLFHLDSGGKMLAHLGMTGKFVYCRADHPLDKHLCSQVFFANGWRLDHIDVRRFGRLELYDQGEEIPTLTQLGVDPLSSSFNGKALKPLIYARNGKKRRQRAIHTLLLDQSLLAGVGNIYASEALFLAGIQPEKSAARLKTADLKRLAAGLREILQSALEYGGTTVSDFRRVDDKPGNFRDRLYVYDRTGEACRRCQTPIQRVRVGGRSVFFCPKCQK